MDRANVEGRSRAVSIQEMCQRFEGQEQNIRKPFHNKIVTAEVKTKTLPNKSNINTKPESPQWSKSKTQYEELIQKRHQQKLCLLQQQQRKQSPVLQIHQHQPPVNNYANVSETAKLFQSASDSGSQQQRQCSSPSSIHRASFVLPKQNTTTSPSPRRNNNCDSPPSYNNVAKSPLVVKPTPPQKPPRTFAHNVFVQQHRTPTKTMANGKQSHSQQQNGLRSEKTAFPPFVAKSPKHQVFVDLTATTLGPPKNYGTLKRSFSEEHVYADPQETCFLNPAPTYPEYAQPFRNNLKKGNLQEKQHTQKHLHYMSTPIVGVDSENQPTNAKPTTNNHLKQGKSSSPNVRELVNNSFGQLWRRLYSKNTAEGIDQDDDIAGDSGSEVSMKDVQERIIYVRSQKKQIMGSTSLRESVPDRLFDCILLSCVTPARKDSTPKPRLIYRYPKQESSYDQTMIPQLCFPDLSDIRAINSRKSETFVFSVEDESGRKTFGYCLRLLGSNSIPKTAFLTLPAVICLISRRNLIGFYMRILSEVERHLFLDENDFLTYIAKLYNTQMPLPGRIVDVPDCTHGNIGSTAHILRPIDNRIVNAELTFLLQLLEVDLLLEVLATLLLERRVLLVAASSCTLFRCTTAILAILYPLTWQHSVLPVLPNSLLAQCCISSPYLFGVPSQSVHKVMEMQKEKMLIVDLDQGFKLRCVGDEHTILPGRSLKAVKSALNLSKNMTDPTEMLRDVMISEAFVRMFVETLGHCDNCIVEQEPGRFVFQLEPFSKFPSSRSVQMFLAWFCETQMFEAFIEERINCLRTLNIRKQPGFQTAKGLFDRRIEEFWTQQQATNSLRENVRELGKKVRTFGVKLKHFRAF